MKVLRTFDILSLLVEKYPKEDALAIKRNGIWEKFSTAEYKRMADLVSFSLLASGFTKGDKIVTISNNRPEWNFLDMGMSQIGVVHVPVYPNIGATEYEFIFTNSDAKMVIVSSKDFYDKIKPLVKNTANIQHFYTLDQQPKFCLLVTMTGS